jgi:hypothetical protein
MEAHADPRSPPSAEELTWLCEVARSHDLPAGATFAIEVPPSLSGRLAQAPVEAVHLADRRLAILLKTGVGWKDNFHGFLYVRGGVLPAEVKTDAGGRRFISLPAPPPWEELYVLRARDDQLWEIFFDLN